MAIFEAVPLLRHQRALLDLPRDMTRFRAYLELLTGNRAEPIRPPLVAFNPMARAHVAARLDALLAIDAETVAATALSAAGARLDDIPGASAVRFGLVVIDDLKGGWTNRHATELGLRFDPGYAINHGWATVPLWSSEAPTAEQVRIETLTVAYRTWAHLREGPARTLRARLALEGRAARFASAPAPRLDPDDLEYTRQVLAPLLDATDMPTHIACLFGDRAARALGMPPLGLSDRAGLALAVHDGPRDAG